MTTYTTGKLTVTYNGVDVTEQFGQYAASLPALRPTWEDAPELDKLPPTFAEWLTELHWTVRPRVTTRQFCLWRHSFDWRSRKRGHPVHRT